jgi:hypothetical protein
MPSSRQLGLENLTILSPTPPLKFRPLKLLNGNYALQGEIDGDDPSKTSYLAALISNEGTRAASMASLDTCPKGDKCIADRWTFARSINSVYPDFRFAGFEGRWEPFKDAGREVWHLYWKGDFGPHHSIQLALVPVDPT